LGAFSAGAASFNGPGLGFLGSSPFGCKTPEYEVWILLDFLGFSRPNPNLSMSYKIFLEEDLSSRFHHREAQPKTAALSFGMRED
jgi:hypothetical protein